MEGRVGSGRIAGSRGGQSSGFGGAGDGQGFGDSGDSPGGGGFRGRGGSRGGPRRGGARGGGSSYESTRKQNALAYEEDMKVHTCLYFLLFKNSMMILIL